MDVAIVIVIAVVLLLVLAVVGSPSWRAERDAARAEDRLHYDGERQFKRPPNEGDLL